MANINIIKNINYINIEGLKFQDYQRLDAIGIIVINSSAIRILNNEFSNIDYSVTAIGQTPNSSENSQPIIVFGRDPSNPINNLIINGNIIYCTDLLWEDAMIELKKSSLLVVPSRMESLPTNIKEAFYFKIPVIATDVGGIPELITDNCKGKSNLITKAKEKSTPL